MNRTEALSNGSSPGRGSLSGSGLVGMRRGLGEGSAPDGKHGADRAPTVTQGCGEDARGGADQGGSVPGTLTWCRALMPSALVESSTARAGGGAAGSGSAPGPGSAARSIRRASSRSPPAQAAKNSAARSKRTVRARRSLGPGSAPARAPHCRSCSRRRSRAAAAATPGLAPEPSSPDIAPPATREVASERGPSTVPPPPPPARATGNCRWPQAAGGSQPRPARDVTTPPRSALGNGVRRRKLLMATSGPRSAPRHAGKSAARRR